MDFTFLKEDQIWGDDALDVMKRYGVRVAPTDLTVILGGDMTGGGDRTSEDDLTCASWSASSNNYNDVRCVSCEGDKDWFSPNSRIVPARPALSPQEAFKISLKNIHKGINDVQIGEFGEYPQTVASKDISETLELLYQSKSQKLRPTGKNYTFDVVALDDYDTSFKKDIHPEYELDGKRYIRVLGRPYDYDSRLSTDEKVKKGKHYWLEVQPIEWLMYRSGTMVAKKCLFAGIQFDTKDSYDGDFSKTSMKRYLDTYFANEMEPLEQTASRDNEVTQQETTKEEKIEKIENYKWTVLRALAAKNVSPVKGKINPKRSAADKAVIKAALMSTYQSIK